MAEYEDLDLTEEEMGLLGTLSDPDVVSKDKFGWTQDSQREILSLFLHDKDFLVQSMSLIKAGYFTNEAHQLISRLLFNHFKKYSQLPSKVQLIQEICDVLSSKDSKSRVSHVGELNTVYSYFLPAAGSREYYLDKITNFAQTMAMKVAFSQAMEERAKGENEETWAKVRTIIKEALEVDRGFDMGIDYFQDAKERYERMRLKVINGESFTTCFKECDDALGGGLSRGEVGSVIGLSGSGKSIWLVNAALANLHLGKKVLYISLELNKDDVGKRFDTMFANPNPYDGQTNGITIGNLLDHEEQVLKSLESYIFEKEDKRIMMVKQFPNRRMDIPMLRAFYSQVVINGFQPDLVIIDYVGCMKDYPNMPTWQSREMIVGDLRTFATEEDIGVLTAMQPGKSAKEVVRNGGVIDDDNNADSYGQTRPLDAFWSLNRTIMEEKCGLARFYSIKHRNGKAHFTIYLQMCPITLKMRQISETAYKAIYNKFMNERNVDAAEAMQIEGEVKKKQDNWKKSGLENYSKKNKNENQDGYDIISAEKPKFNDVGNPPEDETYTSEPAPEMTDV